MLSCEYEPKNLTQINDLITILRYSFNVKIQSLNKIVLANYCLYIFSGYCLWTSYSQRVEIIRYRFHIVVGKFGNLKMGRHISIAVSRIIYIYRQVSDLRLLHSNRNLSFIQESNPETSTRHTSNIPNILYISITSGKGEEIVIER